MFIASVSIVSIWRLYAILQEQLSNFVGALIIYVLFWVLVVFGFKYLRANSHPQRWILTTLAMLIWGGVGLLWVTPAGLSRAVIEIYAEKVWSPTSFSIVWQSEETGLDLQVPFNMVSDSKPVPVNLEITTVSAESSFNENWLVGATWANGESLSLTEFQADSGWQYQQVDWAHYRDYPVWISQSNQAGNLRWAGVASGPLTLTFLNHNRSGDIIVRWNDTDYNLNLASSAINFSGLNLPLNKKPNVWRAELPVNALFQDISLSVETSPNGSLSFILNKIRMTNVPGRPDVEFSKDELFKDLQFKSVKATPTTSGVEITRRLGRLPYLLLNDLEITPSDWSENLPVLENVLLVLHIGLVGGIIFGLLSCFVAPKQFVNINLASVTMLLTIIVGNTLLRLSLPPTHEYYVWEPNLHTIFNPRPGIMPGVEGEKHLITNSNGIRGDEISPEHNYRILTVGGSTTECLFLDQTETWPHLLQENLNNQQTNRNVWVGNVGRSGHSTREHILQVKHLLQQDPNIDTVLLLVGANDLALRLQQDHTYDPNFFSLPEAHDSLKRHAFDLFPKDDPFEPLYRRTAVWQLVDQIYQAQPRRIREVDVIDLSGEYLVAAAANRKNSPIQNSMPDLSLSLEEYRRNINTIIDIAKAHNVRVILMTQPTMWRSDLSQAEKDLLWFGWGAIERNNYFYSVEVLAEGMALYNEVLLELCHQRQIECLDLANMLPKDTTVFYDDMHFNESGASQIADIITNYMLDHRMLTTP